MIYSNLILYPGGALSELSSPMQAEVEKKKQEEEDLEVARLKAELVKLREDLSSARQTIVRMHDREEKMKER